MSNPKQNIKRRWDTTGTGRFRPSKELIQECELRYKEKILNGADFFFIENLVYTHTNDIPRVWELIKFRDIGKKVRSNQILEHCRKWNSGESGNKYC